MTGEITLEQLQNASADAQTLEEVVNGDDQTDVTTRLGENYMTLQKALRVIVESGLLGATPFSSYAAMDASGLVDGDYAVVTQDSDDSKNGIYQKITGTWTYSKYNPIATAKGYVDSELLARDLELNIIKNPSAINAVGKKIAFAFTDEDDKTGAHIDEDGNISGNNIASDKDGAYALALVDDDDNAALAIGKRGQLETNGIAVEKLDGGHAFALVDEQGNAALVIDKSGNIITANASLEAGESLYAYAIVDDDDNIAFAVDKKGNVVFSELLEIKKSVEQLQSDVAKPDLLILDNQKTDYMHLFSYGQSLSRGVTSLPVLSTSQPHNNVTFNSGVLARFYEVHDYSGFKPLIEEASANNEGESPTSAMCNLFTSMNIADGDAAANWQMVGTAAGQGGKEIEALNAGTLYYTSMIAQVTAARDVANGLGKSYSVWGLAWTQGEGDQARNTTTKEYKDALTKLMDDFCKDVVSITKQSFRPPFVMYQAAANRRYNKGFNIPVAQLELSEELDDLILACPIYQLETSADDLHLTNDSSVQLGKYYAKALYYSLKNKKSFQPVKPISFICQGRVIDISLHVQEGLSLTFDGSVVTQNQGFDIWQDDTLIDIIDTVTIVEGNRVRITLNSDLPANTTLCYARGRVGDAKPSGALRDNAGDTDNYVDSDSNTRYMHNWCVMFQLKLN